MAPLKVTSRHEVWTFAVMLSCVAGVFAPIVIFAVYPPDLAWYLNRLVPFIAFTVAFPICAVVGSKMLENHILSTELQRLVNHDRLTNLATREYFFDVMDKSKGVFGVSLMVDIDHFKHINDQHGHLVGDTAILEVARRLQRGVRPGDLVCRFGGEEFLIFLADADLEGGQITAERIRRDIADHPMVVDDRPLRVTVSIGGSFKSQAVTVIDSIRQADAALYKAKNLGRNRVVMDPPLYVLRPIVASVGMPR